MWGWRYIKEAILSHLRDVRYRITHNGRDREEIICDEDGMRVLKNEHRILGVKKWRDMKEVEIYQRNVFTTDSIIYCFIDHDGGAFNLDDFMVGFYELPEKVDIHFPGFAAVAKEFARKNAKILGNVDPVCLDLRLGQAVKVRSAPNCCVGSEA